MKGTDSKKISFALLMATVMLAAAVVPIAGATDNSADDPPLTSPDPTDIMVLGSGAGEIVILPVKTGGMSKGILSTLGVLKPSTFGLMEKIERLTPVKKVFTRAPIIVGNDVQEPGCLMMSGSESSSATFLSPTMGLGSEEFDLDALLAALMGWVIQFEIPSTYDVDSVKVLGSGDTVVLGYDNKFNFGPEGKYVFGPGSTLALNGAFTITGSGTVMEIQPGAEVEVVGNTFTVDTPLAISVKGSFVNSTDFSIDLLKNAGMEFTFCCDISDGGILSIGDAVIHGGAGKEVDLAIVLQADMSSLLQYDPEGEDDIINLLAGIKMSATASVETPRIQIGETVQITSLMLDANISAKFPSDWTDPQQNVIEAGLTLDAFLDFGKEPKAIIMEGDLVFDGPGFKRMLDGEALMPTFSGNIDFSGPIFVESEGMEVTTSQAKYRIAYSCETDDDGEQLLKVDEESSLAADVSLDKDGVAGYIKIKDASEKSSLRVSLTPPESGIHGFFDALGCIELHSFSSKGSLSLDAGLTYDGITVSLTSDAVGLDISAAEFENDLGLTVLLSYKKIEAKVFEGTESYSLVLTNGVMGPALSFDKSRIFEREGLRTLEGAIDSLVIGISTDCSLKTPTQSYEVKALVATIAIEEDEASELKSVAIVSMGEMRVSVDDSGEADPSHITKADFVIKGWALGMSPDQLGSGYGYLPGLLNYCVIEGVSATGTVEGKPFSIAGTDFVIDSEGYALAALDMTVPEEIKGSYTKVSIKGAAQSFEDGAVTYELCSIMTRMVGSNDSSIVIEKAKMMSEGYDVYRFLEGTVTMDGFQAPYYGFIIDGATLDVGDAVLGDLTLVSGDVDITGSMTVSVLNYVPTVDLTAKGKVAVSPEYDWIIQYGNEYFQIPWGLDITVVFDLSESKFYGAPAPGYVFSEYVYDPIYPDGMEYELLPDGTVLFDHSTGTVMNVQFELATFLLKIGEEEPIEVTYNDYVELPTPGAILDATFIGWSDGSTIWNGSMFMPARDVVLTPIYATNYNGQVSEIIDTGMDSISFTGSQVDSIRGLGNGVTIGFDKMSIALDQDTVDDVFGTMSLSVSVEEIKEGTYPNMGKAMAYAIDFVDDYGSIHYLGGNAKIFMPVPAGWDTEKMAVMHMDADTGLLEPVDFEIQEIDGAKYVVANTNHFSEFIMEQADTGYVPASGGLNLGLIIGIVVVVLIVVLLAAAVVKKKA